MIRRPPRSNLTDTLFPYTTLFRSLATCVLVVLFFTMSAGKRDMYILPALPMLALAAAPFLDGLLERRGVRRALFALALLLGLGLLAAGVAALAGEPRFELKQIGRAHV